MTEVEAKLLVEQPALPQQSIDANQSCELVPQQDCAVKVFDPNSILPNTLSREVPQVAESSFVRKPRNRPLRKKDPVVKLAYRCLLEQFEAMLAEETRAWEGSDVEGVHQMRVTTRRIRAALRAFKSVFEPDARNKFNCEFKWLARVLGDVRDLDVYQENLRDYMDEIPAEEAPCLDDYRQHLAQQWHEARQELLACLSGERYRLIKSSFAEFLQRGPSADAVTTAASVTIRDAAVRLIGKQYKRVLRDGRSITLESPREKLHTLRIECKRLRYLFEYFRDVYGKSLKPFIEPLKALQDVLGEFQDAHVATEQLRQHADCVPMQAENRGQLLALGQLIASQRRHAASCRARFDNVWIRFDRRRARKRILAVLAGRS